MKYIIDVRTKPEFDSGHVEGALHHDIMDMMQGTFPDLPKDADITLYCESGNRSMMAKMFMGQAGFTNITDGGSIENFMVS
jgi:rhodanese-related sulfurtransferase